MSPWRSETAGRGIGTVSIMRRLFIAGAVGVLLLGAASTVDAAEVFDYQLNGSLADANGGAPITNNGAALGASGLTFDYNEGPTIGGYAATGVYSIEASFSFSEIGGYNKILDFLNRGSDSGLYVAGGALNFYGAGVSGGAFAADTVNHLVVTRDAANLFKGYLNGVEAISFTDSGSLAVIASDLRFFSDDFATGQGEASPGFVDYIRTYDTALSAGAVAELYRAGGDVGAAVPEPAAWAMMIVGFGGVGAVMRRRRTPVLAEMA